MSWRDDDQQAERDWTAAVIALADETHTGAPPPIDAEAEPAAEPAAWPEASTEAIPSAPVIAESAAALAAPSSHPEDGVELARRLHRLTMRVEIVAGLVESLFDRLSPATTEEPLTAEKLADISARVVQLIENRLEAQSELLGQTNTRLASDVEQMHRDLRRYDQVLVELQSTIAELPDRQALRDLYSSLASMTAGDSFDKLRDAVTGLPEQLAIQQPVNRLDAAIIQQIDARLEETADRMAEKLDDQLAARVQRFEALSQSMITLAGEPVDALSEKLQQLAKLREPAADLVEEVAALRREGQERDALLRELLAALNSNAPKRRAEKGAGRTEPGAERPGR